MFRRFLPVELLRRSWRPRSSRISKLDTFSYLDGIGDRAWRRRGDVWACLATRTDTSVAGWLPLPPAPCPLPNRRCVLLQSAAAFVQAAATKGHIEAGGQVLRLAHNSSRSGSGLAGFGGSWGVSAACDQPRRSSTLTARALGSASMKDDGTSAAKEEQAVAAEPAAAAPRGRGRKYVREASGLAPGSCEHGIEHILWQ